MRKRATYRASDVQGYLPRRATRVRINWTECAYTLAASAIVAVALIVIIETL